MSSVQVTSFVKEVHWKRRVEEDTRSELGRGFVGLDVVHDRVHVHDLDGVAIAHDRHERQKSAIPSFHLRN